MRSAPRTRSIAVVPSPALSEAGSAHPEFAKRFGLVEARIAAPLRRPPEGELPAHAVPRALGAAIGALAHGLMLLRSRSRAEWEGLAQVARAAGSPAARGMSAPAA